MNPNAYHTGTKHVLQALIRSLFTEFIHNSHTVYTYISLLCVQLFTVHNVDKE